MLLAFSSIQNFEDAFIHEGFLLIAVSLTFTLLSRFFFVSFVSCLYFLLLLLCCARDHITEKPTK